MAEKTRVLLVEDEADIQDILTFFLEDQGYEVKCMPNGAMAENAAFQSTWDVVVTDLNMPIMGGVEFVKRLRVSPSKDAVVFVISGQIDKSAVAELVPLGVTNFVVKPFDSKELVLKIKAALEEDVNFLEEA